MTAAWGLTFPIIKDSVKSISPFSFVSIRFFIGSLFLWIGGKKFTSLAPAVPAKNRAEWISGVILGLVLFCGYSLQTIGLKYTSASNAGFITGLAVVMVPLIMIFSGNKIRWFTWFAIGMSTVGIALLSLGDSLSFGLGDLLILGCAFAFALHIVLVGKFSLIYDPVRMTNVQILVCAVVSGVFALLTESSELGISSFTQSTVLSLIFCGVVATALAFLVQSSFQRFSSPVKTALIFTCEPVFGAIFSVWIASEMLNFQQYFGGAMMVLAMVVGEIGPSLIKGRHSNPLSDE